MEMNIDLALDVLPFLLKGAWVTLQVSVLSIVLATVFGFFMAMLRMSNNVVLNKFAFLYIWVFRGLPLLIVLFILYYSAPFGMTLTAFVAGVLGMTLLATAFKAEIIRAGMLGVNRGQIEAAEAIGMTPLQIMLRIKIPQMVRLIIPPYLSNSVIILKDSSLMAVITVPDLMMNAQLQYSTTYSVVETLGVASVLYLAMTSVLMIFQSWVEKKLKVSHNNR